MKGFHQPLTAYFHQRLAERGAEVGLKTEVREGYAIVLDVPEPVRQHFAKRTADATANAKSYAEGNGLKWDDLPKKYQTRLIKVGARKTEGSTRDGMADRPGWRAEMAAMGFPPTDLVSPARARPVVEAWRARAALVEKAEAGRQLSVQTLQMAQQRDELAKAEGRPTPSPARRSAMMRAVRAMEAVQQAMRHPVVVRAAEALRDSTAAVYRRVEQRGARAIGNTIHALLPLKTAGKALRYISSGRVVRDAQRLRDVTAATVEAVAKLGPNIRAAVAQKQAERAAGTTASATLAKQATSVQVATLQTQQKAAEIQPKASPAQAAERKFVQATKDHLSPAMAHLVAVHGTEQNVIGTRARTLSHAVVRGEMGTREATTSLYQLWQRLSSEDARRTADPDKVWTALERRLEVAVEVAEKRLDRQEAKAVPVVATSIEQAEAARWESKRQRGEAIAPRTPSEASQGQQMKA